MVVAAIAAQIVHTRGLEPPGSIVDFFSFFTIEANVIAVAVFVIGAIPGREPRARWYDLVRGAATTYMSVTGVVYAVLLSDLPAAADSTIPWVNEVLHYLMPLIVFLDWLFVPPEQAIRFRESLTWAAFPLVYAIYSLIRGAATSWYPYPFLNVDRHGLGRVLVNCVGIGIGTIVFVAAIGWLGNAMHNGRTAEPKATGGTAAS